MPLSEDEIDYLLYLARIGDKEEFRTLNDELCVREKTTAVELLEAARDGESGNGVLHMAAANGYEGFLRDLCKALSNPSPQNPAMLAILNAQNKAGNTALHWAALNGHLESVKVLLEEGSDPTITNQRGHDAVYEAELNDKKEVVEWVLKEGGEGLEEGLSAETGDDTADEGADEEIENSEELGANNGEHSRELQQQLDKMAIHGASQNT